MNITKKIELEQERKEELKQSLISGKLLIWVGGITLSLAVATVLLIAYWLNTPHHVLDITNDPVPSVQQVTQANQVIYFKVNYCKNTNATGLIERYLVTQYSEIKLPEQTDNAKRGCQDDIELPVLMPTPLRSSDAHIRWRVTYRLNPLRTVVEEFSSQSFQIIGEATGLPGD